ncbi:retron Ec67 family RNA-directed DNA polymerase/endonuclease [Xanthomonas campestris]|uniref:retron Ec67 family RNA-directed DNA polymerase/endonuclease n=1 Tax=Xanthomonas TaxID=338 RepID=UPI001E55758C|nr:retron Ec67 family RNA-directed DNA polymerase/endonuclease [Xanthomonas campestris]MCC5087149.1 retron Ec67 family RNA-directed DNA polymerase/endonuclease [Xanthomonas campestris]MEB1361603.1 retron Ec67 family RNA-directed DNA polymerase/endonuclease [Xanthomonas campestris pv. campestris]
MGELAKLKACTNTGELARLLDFQTKTLSYIAWGTPSAAKYSAFDIPKRSGGKRAIHAPSPQLKLVQGKLSKLLQACEKEIEEELGVKHPVAHGFKQGRSILTNADVHRRQRYVLNFDLTDFFGTINFGRVRGFLIGNRNFQLHRDVATIIAQIACHDDKLPQGAPTSPVISNLIGNILDIRLSKIARAQGCAYSRYADDITMSTSQPQFPHAIARQLLATPNWVVTKEIEEAVKACGFKINHAKTRLLHHRSRQDVTGIVVNRHVNVNGDYRRAIRAMVNRLCSTGTYHLEKTVLAAGQTMLASIEGSRPQLEGMLGFLLQVERYRRSDDLVPPILSATERLLHRFLFFTTFAANDRTAILFEGKTDNIYISSAIRKQRATYPALIAPGSNELLVKLLPHTKTRERIFNLTGGDSPLTNFIVGYRDNYRKIKGPKGSHPVIVIFDNDKGSNAVIGAIKKHYKLDMPDGDQYIHVYANLYVLLTSKKGSGDHCIEHYFSEATRAKKLSGKKFSLSNKKLKDDEYGKAWFAEKIVKPYYKDIDFSGFAGLLDPICGIIKSHHP